VSEHCHPWSPPLEDGARQGCGFERTRAALQTQIDEVVMIEMAVAVSSFGGLVAGKVEVWSWACRWLARNEVVWQLTYPLWRKFPPFIAADLDGTTRPPGAGN